MLITTAPHIFGKSHQEIIKNKIANSDALKLAVAFVQKAGVALFRDEIIRCIRKGNGGVKLICSSSFGITNPSAIRELKDIGVEIKLHSPNRGVFHPKLWLFRSNSAWACLVGSANFSYAACNSNIEIGVLLEDDSEPEIVEQATGFFEYLWSDRNSQDVNGAILESWDDQYRKRIQIMKKIPQLITDNDEGYKLIESFVKNWIDGWQAEKEHSSSTRIIGRGWYIIPVHDRIDDALLQTLHSICSIIKNRSSGKIDVSSESADSALGEILSITSQRRVRANRITSPRELFIRQEKNYLINLSFAYHPLRESGAEEKGILILSNYGHELADASTSLERKAIYTKAVHEHQICGLNILEFTRAVLTELKFITFNEFSYFINHIFSMKDVTATICMVYIYRKLPDNMRENLDSMYAEYFIEKLEEGSVQMNYNNHVQQTMSVLGWCSGLSYDENEHILSMDSPHND